MRDELTIGEVMAEIPSRFIGFNDVWRDNSTGTNAFFVLWIPVWWKSFTHSTAMFD